MIATNCSSTLDDIKKCLKLKFCMKDLGQISYFLGIQFVCENGMIKMNQARYIEKLWSKFNPLNATRILNITPPSARVFSGSDCVIAIIF